jgi:hypothetical protein
MSTVQRADWRGRDAGGGRAGVYRARRMTRISIPSGSRLSGDKAGDYARVNGRGRCSNGHQAG